MATTTTTDIVLYLPTPGSREPAAIALLNTNFVNLSAHDHGALGSGKPIRRVVSGLAADRGGAGTVGSVYYATDTGEFSIDTGSVWTDFLVEGGQADTTGWIMNDPVVRDELLFGQAGGGADDAFIRRTGVNILRTDASLGMGQTIPSTWSTSYTSLAIGQAGSILSSDGSLVVSYRLNSYTDGTDNKAIVAGVGAHLNMSSTAPLSLQTAPSVAADAIQAFTERLRVDASGNLGLGIVPNAWITTHRAIQLGVSTAIYNDGINTTLIANNNYWDGGNKAIKTGAAIVWALGAGTMSVYTAPSVAAGAAQSFDVRWTMDIAGNLGIGIAPPAVFDASIKAVYVGTATLYGQPAGNLTQLRANTHYDGSNNKAVIAGGSTILDCSSGQLAVMIAPSVAAGATQTHATRFSVSDASVNVTMANSGNLFLHAGNATNSRIATGIGNLELSGAAGYIHPSVDNTMQLGASNLRWQVVYAVNGTIQTSVRESKQDFTAVSPDAALEAVKRTPIQKFRYKPTQSEDGHELLGTEQVGYVAEDADPLLTLDDNESVSAQHTASVALAAIQALLVRVEALEGARGQNPRQPTP